MSERFRIFVITVIAIVMIPFVVVATAIDILLTPTQKG